MTNKILKALGLPALISGILGFIAAQQKFMQQKLAPILQDAMKQSDGSLDDADIKKINNYYGLAVPAILGEAFCALRGYPMTADERWASTCQGGMTGLFDDFFDKDYLSDEAVENMISEKNRSLKKSNQRLFDFFYKNAMEHVPDKNSMQSMLNNVYHAQVGSKKQYNPISNQELTSLTYDKGGYSVLFYRTAFAPAVTASEHKLIYHLGAMMQLSNDIFDIYKDREAGIRTLVTETKDIGELRKFFSEHLQLYYQDAFNSGFPKKNIRRFLNIISIGVFSRSFVCLGKLEQNQRKTNNEFNVHSYSRSQLICDMDKKSNMLRSAWHHISNIY